MQQIHRTQKHITDNIKKIYNNSEERQKLKKEKEKCFNIVTKAKKNPPKLKNYINIK